MGHALLAAIAVSVIAAAALALLARSLRQPLILGYIAGGVVLGRHLGLGVVSDEASIDVPRVLQAGRTILVLGLLQFPLCAGLAWYAMRGAVADFGGRLDGLYVAVALALSSTLIVVKLIFDKLEIATEPPAAAPGPVAGAARADHRHRRHAARRRDALRGGGALRAAAARARRRAPLRAAGRGLGRRAGGGTPAAGGGGLRALGWPRLGVLRYTFVRCPVVQVKSAV